mmetsp:Transcript_23318/g.34257  ORF Transcript_23318/g.34257 Transcript_23318/m.34257 type:complete len:485 (-) Transcript_23318:83-1537(-)
MNRSYIFTITLAVYSVIFTSIIFIAFEKKEAGSNATAEEEGFVKKEAGVKDDTNAVVDIDRFSLWSRRGEISNETIAALLKSISRDSLCFKKSISIPKNSLEQIALAIKRRFSADKDPEGQTLVFAVIGDSVAADLHGFVEALQSFFTLSPHIPFVVEVRNYAHGGKGPCYFSFCNDLRGDEDVVVFENVRPYEAACVYDMAHTLISDKLGIILYNWHGPRAWNMSKDLAGFERPSNELNLPLIDFPTGRKTITECLPANVNFSIPEENQIYRDEVHPNRLGELIIATMIGQLFEDATMIYKNMKLDLNKIEKQRLLFVDTVDHGKKAECFNQLNCSLLPAAGEEFGHNHCLNVISTNGFEKKSLPSGKFWWEGTLPGHSIQILLPGSCLEIALFHNLRVTNGMVQVEINGQIPESTALENGVLDGWFEGFSWLPRERAHERENIIAYNLQKADKHIVQLTVINETNSEDGTHKFDFTSIACKK